MKRPVFKLALFLLVFSTLVFYNYQVAQKKLKNVKDTVFSINIINPATSAKVNEPVSFSWSVDAPRNFQTKYTTIYYGNVSTPSALVKTSSPDSVKYKFRSGDYVGDNFYLPNTFSSNLTFSKAERIWYRGYAKIGDDHLWTEEKYLDIQP
jgi:hypothetical protein